MFNYQLYFSKKRKTLGLQVKKGQLTVRAPSFLTEAQVEAFVLSKKLWIEKKLALSQQPDIKSTSTFDYSDGDTLFVFGIKRIISIQQQRLVHEKQNPLNNTSDVDSNITLTSQQLIITLPTEQYHASDRRLFVRAILQQWFDEQISQYVLSVLPVFEQQMNLFSQDVKFRIYKSRWGSCNSRQQLTFNSLLAMAPHYVIDYVIIHELAHIKHMNHSIIFWQLVDCYCHQVDSAKTWLKAHHKVLHLPD